MKISKGFIAQLVAALLISITFMGLGNWQLNRAHDVKIAKQIVPDSARISLEKIAATGSNLTPDAINRLVSVSGKYRETFLAPKQPITSGDKK